MAELRPQVGSQEVAAQCDADIVVYGGAAGSGKSYLMLLKALMGAQDPYCNAVIFRRTSTTLRDGLWGEAKQMYRPWKPKLQEQPMRMEFDNGAVIKFNHMQHESDAERDHQGKQYSLVMFDEGCQFEQTQVEYLISRMRSAAEGKSQMFISCNPDPDSFLCDWIDWWLDDDGYPIEERSGVKRFFCRVNGNMEFADSAEELREAFPDSLRVYNPLDDSYVEVPPMSLTFIRGTIFDNPALIKANPQYLANLNSLPDIEKARLLHGNWYARPEGSAYFRREWLKPIKAVPHGAVYCRAWDKASTQPSEVNKSPDYTACTKMAKDKNGNFYLIGGFHPEITDQYDDRQRGKVFGRFRENHGVRDSLILKQSLKDGVGCTVVLAQDPGSAGVTEYQEAAKKLISEGLTVKKDPMPPVTGKLTRFAPFASACEHGMVYIVESTFEKASLEAFYKELEAFDGERSTRTRKDDWPDSVATAFNHLCKTAVIPTFTLTDFQRPNPFNV